MTRAATPLGETLAGRFKVTAFLGNSRGTALYLAEQAPLGRNVVVKLLDPMEAESPQRRRFFREAHALVKLSNPHIVRVYDLGTWGDRPYLVTEHIGGKRLSEVLAEGPIDPLRLVEIARQVCAALVEPHAEGLVHRDLRPENIALVEQGAEPDFVKVVDFGLVKDLDSEEGDTSAEGSTLGSPAWASPEQLKGGAIDPRVDVYALGVTLFLGLTGRLPHPQANTVDAVRQQLTQAAPRVPDALGLPPACAWTVATCLEKDRDRRFGDMVEVERALRLCALALLRPEWRDAVPTLVEGRTVLPDGVPDDPYVTAPPAAKPEPAASGAACLPVVGVVAALAFLGPLVLTILAIALRALLG